MSKLFILFLACAVLQQQVFAFVPIKFFPTPYIDPVGLFFMKKAVAVPAAIKVMLVVLVR